MRSEKTKKLTVLALTVAAAMLLSYIEHILPVFIPIAGVKIGLANIATVFALYVLGEGYAAAVSGVRVLLSALLFGTALGLLYSASGAIMALALMFLLKRTKRFSAVGVSVAGGVAHNIAQITAASIVMRTTGLIVVYLPVLLIFGTVAGVVIGLASGLLVNRLAGKIK